MLCVVVSNLGSGNIQAIPLDDIPIPPLPLTASHAPIQLHLTYISCFELFYYKLVVSRYEYIYTVKRMQPIRWLGCIDTTVKSVIQIAKSAMRCQSAAMLYYNMRR
jgi:hypothetical protein